MKHTERMTTNVHNTQGNILEMSIHVGREKNLIYEIVRKRN